VFFSVAAPQLWSNLPSYIKTEPSHNDFKSLLKTQVKNASVHNEVDIFAL